MVTHRNGRAKEEQDAQRRRDVGYTGEGAARDEESVFSCCWSER